MIHEKGLSMIDAVVVDNDEDVAVDDDEDDANKRG